MIDTDRLDLNSEWKYDFCVSAGKMYHMFFNWAISAPNPPGALDTMNAQMGFPLGFCEDEYYFCISGLPKSIYTGVYGYQAVAYMEIFTPIRHELLNLLREHGWTADIFMITLDNDKQFGIIMSPTDKAASNAVQMAAKINHTIQCAYEKNILKDDRRYCNVTALSDGKKNGLDGLREAFLQARGLHKSSFFHMDSAVITSEIQDSYDDNSEDFHTILDACDQVFRAMDDGDEELCRKQLETLFLCRLKSSCDYSLLEGSVFLICNSLEARISARKLEVQCALKELLHREHFHRIEEYVEAILPFAMQLCHAVQEQGAYSNTILLALHYIHMHFMEDLSVGDIAEYVGVTPSYLSNEFKNCRKESLRDYITRCRMERAMQMLRERKELRIGEVCEAVGIHDAKYFTRLFKRMTGTTPANYRQESDKENGGEE